MLCYSIERTNNEYRNDASVLYEMAICYYEVGEDDAAREFARNTLELAPEHEGALALMTLFP